MTQRILLIVEPDEAIAHLFAEVLEEEGYAVARASGPRDAVRQLSACGRERFDLVLSASCTNPHVAPYAWLDRHGFCRSPHPRIRSSPGRTMRCGRPDRSGGLALHG